MGRVEEIRQLLEACSAEERHEVFQHLRNEFWIHPIELQLNIRAEIILEAIARASDLTLRGVRGVIAEAAFETYVVSKLHRWEKLEIEGDRPYDFFLKDDRGPVTVQVKMQRLKDHKPMLAHQAYRRLPADQYVVETQRTRGGLDPATGEDTRPYRFGEFDILAVSMHPSTNNWSTFLYTVADWLLPRPENTRLMLKFQPVPMSANDVWSDDYDRCVEWLRSGRKTTIVSDLGTSGK